jgi:hypothetical protein
MFSRFIKFFLLLCMGTGMCLLFVAGKVETIKLAYEIRGKERHLAEQYDTLKELRYRLTSLKSPSQLENRMVETELELVPIHEVRVLRFAKRKLPDAAKPIVNTEAPARSHFLSVREAQADTHE